MTTGRLLAVTGGHRVDRDAFREMLDAVGAVLGWSWTHAVQPEAQALLTGDRAGRWEAVLLHDLPGLELARGSEPRPIEPGPEVRRSMVDLLDRGQGIVATHHALAGWPTWDGWAGALGGRFLYTPGPLRGVQLPCSGYRMDRYRVDVARPDHPVCDGVEPFELHDELYLCPVFEDEVLPLLTTDADLSPSRMISACHEVRLGERRPAAPQVASTMLGWAKTAGRSPLVYLLPGHGPDTMADASYRRLLGNALAWVASPGAHRWAAARPAPVELA